MTCLSNQGYQKGECIRSTAARNIAVARMAEMAIIAADNANTAIENFRKQFRISKRANVIAKEEQQHLKDTYWPRELEFLAEFGNGGANDGVETIEAVETIGRRYAGRLMSAVTDRFAKQLHELQCAAGRYTESARRKALQDLLVVKAQALATAKVMGRQLAFAEVKAREEASWNRRMQAAMLGKGKSGQAISLMASAAQMYGDIGQRALGQFNSAFGEFGNAFQSYRMQQGNLNGGISMAASMLTESGGLLPSPRTNYAGQTAWALGSDTSLFSQARFEAAQQNNQGLMVQPSNMAEGFGSLQQYNLPGAMDTQANIGNMSYQDLVRVGTVQFPVVAGQVSVNLDKFELGYADGLSSNELAKVQQFP